MRACPICECIEKDEFLAFKRDPVVLRPLPKEKIDELVARGFPARIDLAYSVCSRCGHLFASEHPDSDTLNVIYKELYGTHSPASGFRAFDEKFVRAFAGLVAAGIVPGTGKVLEIGCSDASVLLRMRELGYEAVGCEPSSNARHGAREGLRIVNDFFSPVHFPDERFDLVYSRQVVEHLEDPVAFLAQNRAVLKEQGRIILETPCGEPHLAAGLTNPFQVEHLGVFTAPSVHHALALAGLEMIHSAFDEKNMTVVARPGKAAFPSAEAVERVRAQASEFLRKRQIRMQRLREVLEPYLHDAGNLVIWGAGSYGLHVATTYFDDQQPLDFVDNAKSKHGLAFLGRENVTISSPSSLRHGRPRDILVASEYTQEILAEIKKSDYRVNKVIAIYPHVEVHAL